MLGYLIPPWKMHPWLKWLIWINPVQYCFEAIMANEFYNMDIQCEPPSIVPDGPNALPGHQSCAIQGSTPDSTIVRGANYIRSAYTYTRSHLWRNFGIVIGWFIFFVALTVLGMEMLRINALHHQAVSIPGQGIVVVAREANGVVQAIENRQEGFIIGVQWHPEYWVNSDSNSAKIFRAFGDAVRAHAIAKAGARTAAE